VLVSTFGFDERKVFRAMRMFPYDRLCLIGGPDSFRSAGFRRLRELEAQAGGAVDTTAVDPHDFTACFRGALSVLAQHPRSHFGVRVSVAGGTKVLADAATLAAFHEGVECWHVDGDVAVRLPILRGFRFVDALTPAERIVLALVTRRRPSQDLLRSAESEGIPASEARGALASLIRKGLVGADLDHGRAMVSPIPPKRGRDLIEREAALKYRPRLRPTRAGPRRDSP